MTAFRAAYADLKIVKTRGVCQVILELPLEQADAALEILGGVPRPDREVWVGVARLAENAAPEPAQPALDPPPVEEIERPKRPFHTLPLPTQAVLLCKDVRFQEWSGCRDEASCAANLRLRLGIASRADIKPGSPEGFSLRNMVERYRIETGQMAEDRG